MTRVSAVVVFLVSLAGCGVYSFTGQGISGIKTIAVEPFENRTSEFGIREDLADALVTKLQADRSLTLAGQRSADAVLRGVIVSVEDRPLTFTAAEEVTEYLVTIAVDFTLLRQGRAEPIWQARIVGEGAYPYQIGSPEERARGIRLAVDRLVQDVVNRLTSDW